MCTPRHTRKIMGQCKRNSIQVYASVFLVQYKTTLNECLNTREIHTPVYLNASLRTLAYIWKGMSKDTHGSIF